jgi:two-component system response regulator TctD
MRVLLIEDNVSLSLWMAKSLRESGLVVDRAFDGAEADHVLLTQEYDIVLLDLALPRVDGLVVLRRLRARQCRVPVIVITAKGSIEDRILGLDSGADDYMPKPVNLAEMEARMRALVRRSQGAVSSEIKLGSLTYEAKGRLFRLRGKPLDLPPREHAVLESLAMRPNVPISKHVLADRIVDMDNAVSVEAIEIYVHRLRKRLEESGVAIRTLRGLGYLLEQHDA